MSDDSMWIHELDSGFQEFYNANEIILNRKRSMGKLKIIH